jgi:FkbM family methyltransferase
MQAWRPRGCPGMRKDGKNGSCAQRADFTRWVVSERLLHEPFVLIDVGVQGRENQRWQPLGDHLVVHRFDPIEEVVRELTEQNDHRPNCHYHCMAVGNVDGEQEFYFNPANPTASSMFRQGISRFDVENVEQPRQVPIRRLDSLLAEGLIPQADFIKVDVEGFEKDVLLGARELLSAGVLGLHTETNFGVSPHYPKGHFATLAELALDQHLLVFDIAFNRIPRASFQRALVDKGMKPISENYLVGRPATVDVLFCRDLIDEVDQPDNYQSPCRSFRLDQLIRSSSSTSCMVSMMLRSIRSSASPSFWASDWMWIAPCGSLPSQTAGGTTFCGI